MALKWYGDDVQRKLENTMRGRISRAGMELVRYAREHIASQPTAGKGKNKRGLAPGPPGGFPHRVLGHLARSLTYEVAPAGMSGVWGTNVLYGKFLELGTARMAARPWMSLTNAALRTRVNSLLGGRIY